MEKLNSYYETANNDFCFVNDMLPLGEKYGNYNIVVAVCADAAERFLKAVLNAALAEMKHCSYFIVTICVLFTIR